MCVSAKFAKISSRKNFYLYNMVLEHIWLRIFFQIFSGPWPYGPAAYGPWPFGPAAYGPWPFGPAAYGQGA